MSEEAIKLAVAIVGGLFLLSGGVILIVRFLWKKLQEAQADKKAAEEERLKRLEEILQDLKDSLSIMQETIAKYDSRLTTNENGHGRLVGRLLELDNKIDAVDTESLERHEKLINKIEAQNDKMVTHNQLMLFQEGVTSLNTAMRDMTKRMDILYKELK